MTRKQDHIFQRPQSQNWYVRLRGEKGRRFIQSLHTNDRREADVLAGPLITEHRARMLAARPHLQTVRKFDPGEHPGPDGGKIVANERELIYLSRDGAYLRTEPNTAQMIVPPYPLSSAGAVVRFVNSIDREPRPTVATKTSDDAFLETYIAHTGLSGLQEKQARDIWHSFRTIVNKPIKDCARDDGRALVAALGEAKSATLRRRMVPLVATVNLAIKDGKLTFNPFIGCVPDRDDEDERDAFSDDDMKIIRANLHRLDKSDQLLVRLLATTGMRRGEAFDIDGEERENGIRFVTIGTKTPQSQRRVPFPADLLPYLPKKITGQLIPGRMDTAGKRLHKWMFEIGIPGVPDPDIRKKDRVPGELNKAPMHSFRHRAAQRMRAAGVPEDVREAVGGWANGKKKKVSRKYGNKHGAGYPLSVLKKAIDTIGF